MLPNSHSVFFCSVRIFVIPTFYLFCQRRAVLFPINMKEERKEKKICFGIGDVRTPVVCHCTSTQTEWFRMRDRTISIVCSAIRSGRPNVVEHFQFEILADTAQINRYTCDMRLDPIDISVHTRTHTAAAAVRRMCISIVYPSSKWTKLSTIFACGCGECGRMTARCWRSKQTYQNGL